MILLPRRSPLVRVAQIINILKIRWENVQEAVPAFLTMIAMPMTYSVAYGFIAGIIGWIMINGSVFCINFVQVCLACCVWGETGGLAGPMGSAVSSGCGWVTGGGRQPLLQRTALVGHYSRRAEGQSSCVGPPSLSTVSPPHPPGQSYFWPKSEDPTLTRMATWKIARQMTFHLHDDEEEEGSDTGVKMDKPAGSATEEVEPAAAKV